MELPSVIMINVSPNILITSYYLSLYMYILGEMNENDVIKLVKQLSKRERNSLYSDKHLIGLNLRENRNLCL
jgi:hypothetical protein